MLKHERRLKYALTKILLYSRYTWYIREYNGALYRHYSEKVCS